MPLLTPESLRATLPKVGDELIRTPSYYGFMSKEQAKPRSCVVDYVHTEHLWYRVRFNKGGQYECYKLPTLEADVRGGE